MRLITLPNQSPRGRLAIVDPSLKYCLPVSHPEPVDILTAVANWGFWERELQERSQYLEDQIAKGKTEHFLPYHENALEAALPSAPLFADGSAYIQHVILVRKARGSKPPATLETVPLMYQGESGRFLRPYERLPNFDESWGVDFEGEIGVITDFVPMGTSARDAEKHIKLIVLLNDVSLRGLIPEELERGFGFFQSKPTSAISPIAVTPSELGSYWYSGRVHLPLQVSFRGKLFGSAHAGQMHFGFPDLIAHACRTRDLQPGTLIGSGTVANEDPSVGHSCIVEKRMLETLQSGQPETPFMKKGDRVEISMHIRSGVSLFGKISNEF